MARIAAFVSALLCVVCLLPHTSESRERVPLPDGVFYYQSAATVFGSEAAWVNPAGLARYRAGAVQVMADYRQEKVAKSWGTVVARDGFALAHRKLQFEGLDEFNEYVFGMGFGLGELQLGGSYRYFKDGPGIYDNRHFWNFGLMTQMGSLATGIVLSNVNRGRVDGERSQMEQRYAIGYRPLGNLATLSVDMLLSTGMSFNTAGYVYQLEVNPAKGLYLTGNIDSHQNFQIGIRANLGQYFVGSKSGFEDDGDHGGTTGYLGFSLQRQPSLVPPRKRRLSVNIRGGVAENPPQPIFGRQSTPFVDLILALYRAADDPAIREMVLGLDRLAIGMARAQELRDAIEYFQTRGKRVVCHMSYPNNLSYYVGSVADTLLMVPVGQLNLVGLRSELTFYRGTLEKLGLNIEMLKVGEYKTAPERYTKHASTPENREQVNRILDDLYDQFVDGIAAGRGITSDSVQHIIDAGPFTSAEAIEFGLVDGLSYRDQLDRGFLARLPEVSFRTYRSDTLVQDSWRSKPKIAVVVAEGEVGMGGGGMPPLTAGAPVTPPLMKRAFAQARTNPQVKGVVVRVNSPGGGALAAEEIHRSAHRSAQSKPMYVSMANLTASGAVYFSTPARRFFADPATVTGSIGIYGGKLDASGLWDKLDVGKELYTRGRYAGMMSNVRPFTDDESRKYQSHLDAMYEHFVDLVARSRGLTADSVDQIGRGRVWTGREALEIGLVDELGGLKQVLDYTASALALDDYEIELLPEKRPWIILPGFTVLDWIRQRLAGDGSGSDELLDLDRIVEPGGLYARMPYDLNIY